MKRFLSLVLLSILIIVSIIPSIGHADSALLSPQENLWLKSRDNTIIIYPEKNFPPYSYQNSSGTPQGLSMDYIELIAKKIGAKIQYLPARPLSQILDDIKQTKKADIITSLTDTKEREDFLYFTDNYITVPAIIVVRKDLDISNTLTLNDLSGKKVAVGDKYAVEEFIRTNNPRIVIESVVDDESGLQQVVLGEVDAAVMDIASLSYYLSKQVLNSVKIAGNTGFEYKMAFAVPKDKEILQSIIDKGLQQISTRDRQTLNDKWISIPNEQNTANPLLSNIQNNLGSIFVGIFCIVILIVVLLLLRRRHIHFPSHFIRKKHMVEELEEEMAELEGTSKNLMEELQDVKALEQDIKEKIDTINK